LAMLDCATSSFNPEVAADSSGGGFPKCVYPPERRASAVSDYLKSIGSTNSGLHRRPPRGSPMFLPKVQLNL
jgi:tripeptidyl-peptidase-1